MCKDLHDQETQIRNQVKGWDSDIQIRGRKSESQIKGYDREIKITTERAGARTEVGGQGQRNTNTLQHKLFLEHLIIITIFLLVNSLLKLVSCKCWLDFD